MRVFPIDWPRTCRMPAMQPLFFSRYLRLPTSRISEPRRDHHTFSASIARPTYLTLWRCFFFFLSHSRKVPESALRSTSKISRATNEKIRKAGISCPCQSHGRFRYSFWEFIEAPALLCHALPPKGTSNFQSPYSVMDTYPCGIRTS